MAIQIILLFFIGHELRHIYKTRQLSFMSLFLVAYTGLFIVPILAVEYSGETLSLINYFYVNESTFYQSKKLVLVVLIVAFLGTIIGRRIKLKDSKRIVSDMSSSMLAVNIVVTITFIIYILLSGDMIKGEYTPENTLPGRTYVYRLFFVAYNIGLIMYFFTRQSRRTINYFRLFIGSFFLLSLYIGDRGPLLITVLYYCAWASRNRTWNLRKVFLFGAFGAIILGIIGVARSQRRVEQGLVNRYSNIIEMNLNDYGIGEGPVFELARSTRSLTAAIIDVEENGVYYGFFQSIYFVATIPFLSNIYLKALNYNPDIYGSSSTYFTYLIQGISPSYGNGTNIIADLYIDFGGNVSYFLILLFFIWINAVERQFFNSTGVSINGILFLVYYSVSIYLPRGSILMQLEKVSLIILLMLLFNSLRIEKK